MKMVFNIQFNKVAFRLFKVADCSIFRIFFLIWRTAQLVPIIILSGGHMIPSFFCMGTGDSLCT